MRLSRPHRLFALLPALALAAFVLGLSTLTSAEEPVSSAASILPPLIFSPLLALPTLCALFP